jgi:mRNA-degrading endonuclease RelE of RelBE toxin-antitoxin system
MSHNPKKWDFTKPEDFGDQVRNLPQHLRPKLTEIMTLLSESNNPIASHKRKTTPRGEFYTERLNEDYRLSFNVDFTKRRIIIIRVGDHKFVYGKK